MFEVQTYTLCGGYVNTWLNADNTPRQYQTHRQAMADLRDYFADCQGAVDDGFLDDFDNDLIIVPVYPQDIGARIVNEHVHPLIRERLCLP